MAAMKLLAGSFVALGSILLAAATARAQPPPPPPVPMEDPASPGGYPADLPGRPLILPSGMAEIDASFRIPTDDSIEFFDLVLLTVSGRYSAGTVEPFVGVDLAIYKPDGVDVLASVFGGARAAVGPGAVRGAAFFFSPGTDDGYQELEVDGAYEYKHLVNDQVAIVAEGGLAFNSATFTGITADDLTITAFSLFGRGAGQIKLTPELSGEAGMVLSVPLTTSSNDDTVEADLDTLFGFHGMGLYNVGPFDVYGRLDVRDRGDTTTIFTVGVLARPL